MPRVESKSLYVVALLVAILLAIPSFSQVSPEREAREVFQKLISVAGVSFHEDKVREQIKELLPRDVKPTVDAMGNLVVVLGTGKPEIMFVAHMDEIGLEVTEINQDGTLKTRVRGGSFSLFGRAKWSRFTLKREF
jgi:putative aminopeptidase FrvX